MPSNLLNAQGSFNSSKKSGHRRRVQHSVIWAHYRPAAAQQRNLTGPLPTDGAIQPNHVIQAGRSASAAASAKGLPKADLQACPIDPGDAAISVDVSDAQLATIAKSRDPPPGQRSHAAKSNGGSRPSLQMQPLTTVERTGCENCCCPTNVDIPMGTSRKSLRTCENAQAEAAARAVCSRSVLLSKRRPWHGSRSTG
ncbi:hypothetical protein PhaeoP83_04105 (plasmid) [Phaeobacter inhibens]|uniref:Transposase n=1 Tax=Phaeobacter inhibens TaxID=221822 RepID=A0ABN5GTI5_9RHOB|nr:hypothetical protein PhaeoP83_04105 [Phaeobacter inhibens]AUQ96928.1 hypothetical protein PhaeoP66_04202 [Phaeobacter inhibens]AUR22129.1 hypothetical protein PhaeoP80_04106 [Phaeobacter inhibens]